MGLIDSHLNQIQRLCADHRVKNLYSFGSVNTTRFDTHSDVDLVVDFDIEDPLDYCDHYFALKFELEKVLNRNIDLLENKAIRNSYFRDRIEKSKVLIYGK